MCVCTVVFNGEGQPDMVMDPDCERVIAHSENVAVE